MSHSEQFGMSSTSSHNKTLKIDGFHLCPTMDLQPKKRGKSVTKKRKPKSKRPTPTKNKGAPRVDIMSPEAMENLYYIAHNAPSALAYRGYNWPGKKPTKGARKHQGGKKKSKK
ncbi:hypothetical protein FBUS_04801 [Fasciolopsis buskii]|uniref:Small lysine-rich protein 1 n=1 Tax=Fasciolopsis buskii TaxID=27845 RepID=A0A8E0VHH6_9TREM|nr:hypothetical protein FBUS_04801 [Fasciolopsis buski]